MSFLSKVFNNSNISHYGDIAAIPFFALLFYYFYVIEEKNTLENILMLFCFAGFVLDCLFTSQFLCKTT